MIEFKIKKAPPLSKKMVAGWGAVFNLPQARFFELPERSELWDTSAQRAAEIRKTFDATLIVGIGGSSLGARALAAAFGVRSSHRLIFAEAPDVGAVERWRKELPNPAKVHFLFISKSGKTLETLSLLDYCQQWLNEVGLKLAAQSTVICGPEKSPLNDWAESEHVPTLPVPVDVGGRFSVLSPVGLLPAALLGIPLADLRAGARWALKERQRVCEMAELTLQSFRDGRWITQMWVYSEALQTLGLWWQQLWGESLAKRKSRSGSAAPRVSTPMVCLGPQDQHSLLQQLQEGEPDKWVLCLRDAHAETSTISVPAGVLSRLEKSLGQTDLGAVLKAEADGFLGALDASDIPNITLKMDSSKPSAWGAFFMFWELVIAVLGESLEIDAFDQPGVELGKRLAIQSLR